ncbi:MAG: hypothetical protein ACOC4G_11175 [Bacillota bacterium]
MGKKRSKKQFEKDLSINLMEEIICLLNIFQKLLKILLKKDRQEYETREQLIEQKNRIDAVDYVVQAYKVLFNL